jgi:hypothetical protein
MGGKNSFRSSTNDEKATTALAGKISENRKTVFANSDNIFMSNGTECDL